MRNRTTKTNGQKAPMFRKLTRGDLLAFDNEAKSLIMEAIDVGCIGRVSAKGHCILHNDVGGTVSVPRHMTSPNRTAQNARADMRRLIADQRKKRAKTDAALFDEPTVRDPQTITVSEAFVEHGAAFSRWFDEQTRHGDGLAADLLLYVSFDHDQPSFEVIAAPTPPVTQDTPVSASSTDEDATEPQERLEEDTPAPEHEPAATETPSGLDKDTAETQVEPHPYTCQICGRVCGSPAGLGAHKRIHKAKPNEQVPDDKVDAAVLARVRQALGEDPLIAVLQERVAELEQQLADSKTHAEETQTRLALIQEALRA